MVDFGYDNLNALKDLISPEDEDAGHVFGSALNPANMSGGAGRKEIAKPNAEVVVKVNTRDKKGGANEAALKEAEEAKKAKDPKNQIWNEAEVQEKAEEMPDDRPQPDFEIIPK